MKSLTENNESLVLLLALVIISIIVIVIFGIFLVQFLVFIAIIIGCLMLMSAIVKYAPMPYKIYGAVVCLVVIIAVILFLYFGGLNLL